MKLGIIQPACYHDRLVNVLFSMCSHSSMLNEILLIVYGDFNIFHDLIDHDTVTGC